jgi:hypothetical protein
MPFHAAYGIFRRLLSSACIRNSACHAAPHLIASPSKSLLICVMGQAAT